MLYLLFSLFLSSTIAFHKAEGILNGLNAREEYTRYVVPVMYKEAKGPDQNPCVASILNKWFVQTVAVCFFNKDLGKYLDKEFYILTTTINVWARSYASRKIQVDLVITPKYYDPLGPNTPSKKGNLAVVKLAKDLGNIGDNHPAIGQILIAGSRHSYANKVYSVVGYGLHRFDYSSANENWPRGTSDGNLRYAKVTVLSDEHCRNKVGNSLAEGNMCAIIAEQSDQPMGICDGDSGAPLVYQNITKGIAITGYSDCDNRYLPGIYLNTTYYYDFIQGASVGRITKHMNVAQLKQLHRNQFSFVPYQRHRNE